MTKDEFYQIYKKHRKAFVGEQSSEEELGTYFNVLEKALLTNYDLCKQVFSTCDIDFINWFEEEGYYKEISYILSNYKSEELLNILKNHIYSFNDVDADKKIDNMINDLLIGWKNPVNKKIKKISKKEANIKIVEELNKFKTLSKKEDIYNYYNNVLDRVFCLNYESTFDYINNISLEDFKCIIPCFISIVSYYKKEELYKLIKNKYVELIGINDKEIFNLKKYLK